MLLASTVQAVCLPGRDRARSAIGVLLTDAAAGRGGALLVTGPVGIGRSRLLAETIRAADAHTVLLTAGTEQETDLSYAGLHRLIAPLLPLDDALCAQQAACLRRAVEHGDCPPGRRLALSVAVLALLAEAATRNPVLCCVDDAPALDPASASVLAFVARRLADRRIAMLCTARDGDHLGGLLDGVPELRLDPLDPASSRALLADLTSAEPIDGELAGVLAAAGHGNPGALVDLARSLTPEQRHGGAAPPVTVPADSAVRRAYRARLAALPPRTRWLLLLAAVDEELGLRELTAAADRGGVPLAALRAAESAGLVAIDGRTIRFREPLLRAATYHEATLDQRRAAHRLLAGVLDPHSAGLRRHLHAAVAASGPDPRLAAGLRAAVPAGAAHPVASRALEYAAELEPAPDLAARDLLGAARYAWLGGQPQRARMLVRRLGRTAAPDRVRAESKLLTGEIELRAGAGAPARAVLLAAAGALTGRDRQLAVQALVLAGEALCATGAHAGFVAVAEQALALRRHDQSRAMELMLAQVSGIRALIEGDPPGAIAPLRRVLALAAGMDDPVALVRAGMAGILLGDDARAHQLALRAATLARTGGDAVTVPQALEVAAFADLARGRYAEATAASVEGLRLADACGQDLLADHHLGILAVLAAIVGDRETALRRVRQTGGHADGTGLSQSRAFWSGRWRWST